MAKSAKEPKNNRQRIIDSAWRLFWARGYHATSVADIAQDAGVPKGSVYNYFDSKEALLVQCLMPIRYQTETHLRLKVLEGTLPPGELVRKLLDHYEELFGALEFKQGDPLTGRMGELADTHPEVIEKLWPIQLAWHDVVVQKIWAYATVARIPGLVDNADGLASMIYVALQGVLMQMKISRSVEPINEARRTLVPMVNAYVSAIATGEIAG
ncbi:TetR/AcrR family transcriptional regulator [bacterium]|nr:TetR/AcrR family transcriptional regulator [bacterium]